MSTKLEILTTPPKDGREFTAATPLCGRLVSTKEYRWNNSIQRFELYNFGWSTPSCKADEENLFNPESIFIVHRVEM